MCIITRSRVLFIEQAWNALLIFIFARLFGLQVAKIIYIIFFRNLIDIIHHSNLNWSFSKLGYIFVSRMNHYFHHSSHQEDFDMNYSSFFSFWDHLFGTANLKIKKIYKKLTYNEVLPSLGTVPKKTHLHQIIFKMPVIEELLIWISLITPKYVKNKFLVRLSS